MKKLPIGIQTLSELIGENCIYVDKTAKIHELITAGKYYFLARPRRFGKSLLVSTLAEVFAGNRKLFEDLAIDGLLYDWKEHPVIKISLSAVSYNSPEELEQGIKAYLQNIALQSNISLSGELLLGQMLQVLVRELAKKERVVILIDEYDHPILKYIHQPEIADKMREVLRGFYIVIKDLDPHLKFVLLTGVSRFSKTSIFSGLNNLHDITLSAAYNDLLGYTKDELVTCFKGYLEDFIEHSNYSMSDLLDKITAWYDGYRFSKDKAANHMYNPFSVMLCLQNKDFSNYWFETGTPTFLINLLKSKDYPMQEFDGIKAAPDELGQFEVDDIDLKVLMFQTGYLTIKDYNINTGNYILGYPNQETTDSLSGFVAKSMTNKSQAYFKDVVYELLQAFQKSDFTELHKVLTELFADVPYTIQIKKEKYYQTIFYLMLKMLGADIIVERATNIGRIDAALCTKDTCFIIEFKINGTAAEAIAQIEEKKYYQPYGPLGKKIMLVGIAFDMKVKNVAEIEHKIYNQ